MIAGVPGIGISGIFYLACACFMPVIELVQTMRGRSSMTRWRLVLVQFSIFLGIMGASFSVGFLLAYIIRKLIVPINITSQLELTNVFRMQPILISFIVMAVIFSVMHLWTLHTDRKSK